METKRKMIINADDYGLSPEYNRGIVKLFRAKRLSSASVLVTHNHWRDKAILKVSKNLGLHLDFKFFENSSDNDYEKEIIRQYNLFVDYFGFKPDHFDSHYHAHLNEKIISHVIRVAAKYGLPIRSYDINNRQRFAKEGIKTTEYFIDSWLLLKDNFETGLPKLINLLNNLPAATVELMMHPGFYDKTNPSSYNYERELELNYLLSDQFGELLINNNIGLISWGDI